jgi:hypothetical protein
MAQPQVVLICIAKTRYAFHTRLIRSAIDRHFGPLQWKFGRLGWFNVN